MPHFVPPRHVLNGYFLAPILFPALIQSIIPLRHTHLSFHIQKTLNRNLKEESNRNRMAAEGGSAGLGRRRIGGCWDQIKHVPQPGYFEAQGIFSIFHIVYTKQKYFRLWILKVAVVNAPAFGDIAILTGENKESQFQNKVDVVAETPKQSRWKKGKLIGRRTFGSIYVGSGSNKETTALCALKEFEWCRAPASDVERSELQQMVAVLDSVAISESVDRWT